MLLGRAAKAADLLPDTEKEYLAEFVLGKRFDTGDVTGSLVSTDDTLVSREQMEAAMEGFRGEIMQVPPMYSAVSVNGQRLYKLARQGIEVERQARKISIYTLELVSYDPAERRGSLRVACSKGTYIRTLIEDIAAAAGACGAMSALRRTAACGFSEQEAVPLERLRELAAAGELESVLRPVESLFAEYPEAHVSGPQAARFRNGGGLDMNRLRMPRIAVPPGQRFRVYGPGEEFLGLGRADLEKNQLSFLKLFI